MSLEDFETITKLGEGAFSNVYKVRRKSDNKVYALKKVKLISLSRKEKDNAVNEIRIMASFAHPNIVAYKEAFMDEPSNTLCIVMELAEDGDLLKKINEKKKARGHFSEAEVWDTLIQITRGLKALHDSKILHRDLKCANVFLNKEGVLKLGDLNVSKVSKMGIAHTQTGTPYYASPEIWKNQPYNSSSDIWSLGCVIYEMAALSPPFTANDMQGLYKKVIKGIYPNIPQTYSSDLSNIIKAMLHVNPENRPNCDQILDSPAALRHSRQKSVEDGSGDLLGTIAFVPNFKYLKAKLPKSKYENRERGLSANSSRNSEQSPHSFDIENQPRNISSARNEIPKIKRDDLALPKLPPISEHKDPPPSSRRNLLPPKQSSPKNLSPEQHQGIVINRNSPMQRIASKPEIIHRIQSRQNIENSLADVNVSRPENKPSIVYRKNENLMPSPPACPRPPRPRNLNRIASLILGSPKSELPKSEAPAFPSPMANRIEYLKQNDLQNPIFSPPPQPINSRINRPAKPHWWG